MDSGCVTDIVGGIGPHCIPSGLGVDSSMDTPISVFSESSAPPLLSPPGAGDVSVPFDSDITETSFCPPVLIDGCEIGNSVDLGMYPLILPRPVLVESGLMTGFLACGIETLLKD